MAKRKVGFGRCRTAPQIEGGTADRWSGRGEVSAGPRGLGVGMLSCHHGKKDGLLYDPSASRNRCSSSRTPTCPSFSLR